MYITIFHPTHPQVQNERKLIFLGIGFKLLDDSVKNFVCEHSINCALVQNKRKNSYV